MKKGGSDPAVVWHHRSDGSRDEESSGVWGSVHRKRYLWGEFGACHCNQWRLYGVCVRQCHNAALFPNYFEQTCYCLMPQEPKLLLWNNCCMQFIDLCKLQNALHNFTVVSISIRVKTVAQPGCPVVPGPSMKPLCDCESSKVLVIPDLSSSPQQLMEINFCFCEMMCTQ